jgi:hypothetical protein
MVKSHGFLLVWYSTLAMEQAKPVNHEAVRMLAMELGAREAARRLGLNEDTICSWSHREKWNLPKRYGAPASVQASQLQASPVQALEDEHKALEQRSKSAMAKAAANSAEAIAGPLRVSSTRDLNDLANAMAKVFGWSTQAQHVNIHADKAVIVCDEGRRNELIEQRQRLLAGQQKHVQANTLPVLEAEVSK